MLPSSHLAPINLSFANREGEGRACENTDGLSDSSSLSRQHSKDKSELLTASVAVLASEFSEFISAASILEKSYSALQDEVSALDRELLERNAALNTSLAENQRMRVALQQIVDSMPCGVLVLDHDGVISMINPECKQLLGVDGSHYEDWTSKTLRQISEYSGVNLEASYRDGSNSDAGQEYCVRFSSSDRWIEVRNRRLFRRSVRGPRPDQCILIMRDITAQKRTEKEREAGRKAMALAELTTILAHEIRNPLASLELFAELIEKDEGRRGEWIPNLRAGIRSLSGTVNNVLSFHGSGSLKLVPVSLAAAIGRAIKFIQPLADQAEVSLKWLTVHDQLQVMGSDSGLQQLVLNLVSNAIHHTPAGGCVTVVLKPAQSGTPCETGGTDCEQVMVEFSDTGCGVRSDQIGRIFEPGFSGRGDTSGLGLAVCERIMKQHHGTISVSNIIHSGARFALLFPVLHESQATS